MEPLMFDIVFITNLPSFYKNNLYNEIAKHRKICVIYTGHGNQERNTDFYKGEANFKQIFLESLSLNEIIKFLKIIRQIKYKELIVGGWDSIFFWLSVVVSPKYKNSVVCESSYHESNISGLSGFIKKLFLKKISRGYVSGKAQEKLLELLGFKGINIITKGVGVFNYIKQPEYVSKAVVKKFIYVGRLAQEKNLEFLIKVFSERSDIELHIVGFGSLEDELKSISTSNVIFHGAIPNEKLSEFYQKMDVFILPSKSEPWGLVVEEALNNGLPVIVSDRVGCAEEIVNESNGFIFKYDSKEDLNSKIDSIMDIDIYNKLRLNISKLNFEEIEMAQIRKYIH